MRKYGYFWRPYFAACVGASLLTIGLFSSGDHFDAYGDAAALSISKMTILLGALFLVTPWPLSRVVGNERLSLWEILFRFVLVGAALFAFFATLSFAVDPFFAAVMVVGVAVSGAGFMESAAMGILIPGGDHAFFLIGLLLGSALRLGRIEFSEAISRDLDLGVLEARAEGVMKVERGDAAPLKLSCPSCGGLVALNARNGIVCESCGSRFSPSVSASEARDTALR